MKKAENFCSPFFHRPQPPQKRIKINFMALGKNQGDKREKSLSHSTLSHCESN